jgi:perosamine synthetase
MRDEVFEEFGSKLPSRFLSFPRVPLAVPYWSKATYREIFRTVLAGSVIKGAALESLRVQICERMNVKTAILCGSARFALELALRAFEVGRGDEVVIPTFCCSAIVSPILAVGATPVLADVGAELNLTGKTVDAALTRNTRAIVVPHLFGNPADIEAIVDLAGQSNIRVIDDAAQALGATIDGRPLGSFGDAGVVSFGEEKICFGLGGGVLVSSRPKLSLNFVEHLAKAQPGAILRRLAGTLVYRSWRRWTLTLQRREQRAAPDAPLAPYPVTTMANLQAAVAWSLVRTLDENIAARRARVRAYRELLGNEPGVELIPQGPGSACLTQVVRVAGRRPGDDAATRLIAALGQSGYEVQGSYLPIHLLERFPQCVWDRLPYADRIWTDLVELPCEPSVGLGDVVRICSLVKQFCRDPSATAFPQGVATDSTASGGLC